MKHKHLLFLGGILSVITVLHLYKLRSIPPGLSNDEANIGYEAWSIATTGKDQWGNFLPIVFEGFGNWSLPVSIYALVPFVAVFGPTIVAVRLLSLVSAMVLSGSSYFLVRGLRKTPNDWLALLAAAFIGFTPWIFGLSRTANEVTLAMTFFVAGLVSFLYTQKQTRSIIGTMIFFSLSILTYYGMWIFVPLFLIIVGITGRKKFHFSFQDCMVSMITGVILLSLLALISIRQGGNKRLNQVNIFNDPALVGVLNEKRGNCVALYPGALCQLFFNKPIMYATTYLSNYALHFSLREWFFENSARGILPPGGFFLFIQGPLFLIGIFALLKLGTDTEKSLLFSWIFLSPVADSVTSSGNFTRSFMMAPAIVIICGYSFLLFPKVIQLFVLALLFLTLGSFLLVYTSLFPKANSIFTHYEYQPLVEYLKNEKKPIFISSRYRDTKQYIFLLFYGQISPQTFQHDSTFVREYEKDGWIWVKQINNWHFEKSIPTIDNLPQEAIIVGATKEEIEPLLKQYKHCIGVQFRVREMIPYLNGDPAFSVVESKRSGPIECQKAGADT